MTEVDERFDRKVRAHTEQQAGSAAAKAAVQATAQKLQERKQNPEFYDRLRDLGLDTDEYPWIADRLGPLQAGGHMIGNRSPEYETEIKWLDQNRAERVIAEREPGRLCRGRILEIAQRVHGRPDKEAVDPMTADERRAVRSAMEVITNFKALAIGNTGLSALTDATTVRKTERNEETKTRREKLAGVIG